MANSQIVMSPELEKEEVVKVSKVTKVSKNKKGSKTSKGSKKESSPWTADANTVFGFEEEELRRKLENDAEFKTTFMEHYKKLEGIIKDMKASEKLEKDRARQLVREEKDLAERTRLKSIIQKIQENDPDVALEPEASALRFFDSSIKYLKEWVKEYKMKLKEAKNAEKQAKLDAKEAKNAEKQAKLEAKHTKQTAQMEKMEKDLEKWNDLVDFEVLSFADKLTDVEHFKEMKAYHTRVKLLVQVAKFGENVEGIPEYDKENISDEDLKTMHTRIKLLNQLVKLDQPLDYECDKSIEDLKEMIVEMKNPVDVDYQSGPDEN